MSLVKNNVNVVSVPLTLCFDRCPQFTNKKPEKKNNLFRLYLYIDISFFICRIPLQVP